ncbi:unnamed protein product [Chrysoparadoxa australica]
MRVLSFSLLWLWLCMNLGASQHSPREDEYFGARMRPQAGHQGMYDEPKKGGVLRYIVGIAGGFLLDKLWSGRSAGKLKSKHQGDLETLVSKWQKERDQIIYVKNLQLQEYQQRLQEADATITQLQQAALDAGVDLGVTQTQLDYEEFKQPDVNNDDMISRAEFNQYIRSYLQAYPHIKASDIPKFEDFDLNHDGVVSFQEWERYLEQQRNVPALKELSNNNPFR